MKTLQFVRMAVKEFKDIRKEVVLDFSKLGHGAHFVAGDNKQQPRLGSNGAGKSSLWDALCWGLYGVTPRGLRAPDLRPWFMEKGVPSVEIIVNVSGDPHVLTRKAVTNGLWLDSKVVGQEKIDELIGLRLDSFLHTILIAQKTELFLEMKSAPKLELLSEVADLSRWEDYSAKAKAEYTALDRAFFELQTQQSNTVIDLKEQDAMLKDLSAKSEAWEIEAADEESTRAASLSAAKKLKKAATTRKGNADLALEAAEMEARATSKRLTEAREARSKSKESASAHLAYLQGLDRQLKGYVDEIEGAADGKCSVCGQSLKGTALAKHAAEIGRKIDALTKEAKLGEKRSGALEKEYAGHDALVRKLVAEFDSFTANADNARDAMTRAAEDLAKAEATIKSLSGEQGRADARNNPFRELIKKAKAQKAKMVELLDELDKTTAACSAKQELTKYWIQGFKNIRLYLLHEIMKELDEATQSMLPTIGLDDWNLEYSLEKETQSGKVSQGLDVRIYEPGNAKPSKFNNWSGGEGQRLLIAAQVALSEVLLRHAGIACDLLILDEPTRHMSAEGVGDVCEFLAERGREAQLFYVDHQAVPSHLFASTLQMIKGSEGARLKIRGRGTA